MLTDFSLTLYGGLWYNHLVWYNGTRMSARNFFECVGGFLILEKNGGILVDIDRILKRKITIFGEKDMIEFANVVKEYSGNTQALRGVSLQIDDGEFVFLVGPSGSGKSTIMKLISGELKPTSGYVHVNGYELDRIRRHEKPYLRRTVGVVFQDFRLIENMTVYDNVAFAMRVVGAKRREIKNRVPYVLKLVGLEGKQHRHPNEISGGEQQRLAIARALVNNPSAIIADEPTGNLDPARSMEIMHHRCGGYPPA